MGQGLQLGPKCPAAHSAQAVPTHCRRHAHCPSPAVPLAHWPCPEQGLQLPTGHSLWHAGPQCPAAQSAQAAPTQCPVVGPESQSHLPLRQVP